MSTALTEHEHERLVMKILALTDIKNFLFRIREHRGVDDATQSNIVNGIPV